VVEQDVEREESHPRKRDTYWTIDLKNGFREVSYIHRPKKLRLKVKLEAVV
jgi:hypothetical protein